jgi:alkylation response protein AidB-like acyl-CoA dehydrogenase
MAFGQENGLGLADMVALHRELGRSVIPEPVIASGVIAAGILAGGDRPMPEVLAQVTSGERIATLAWQSGAGDMGADDVAVRAEHDGGFVSLSGEAAFVPWANEGDFLLVAARDSDGVLIAVVDGQAPGLKVGSAHGVDGSRFGEVELACVRVPETMIVASPAVAASLLDRVLDVARIAISAELVGLSEELFRMTLEYLKQRKQFGRPIGGNQTLQFTAVDLYIQIELANSVVASAAAKLDTHPLDAARMQTAAACKSRCSDAAMLMARQAIQLHGAIGYTEECNVSLFVKRAMQWAAWLGTGSLHRTRLRRDLQHRSNRHPESY